jgi:hypothetical protein
MTLRTALDEAGDGAPPRDDDAAGGSGAERVFAVMSATPLPSRCDKVTSIR